MEAAGIAPAASVYQMVLTIASVEPLVSDLFSVTLTPAIPSVSCALRSDDTEVDQTDASRVELKGVTSVWPPGRRGVTGTNAGNGARRVPVARLPAGRGFGLITTARESTGSEHTGDREVALGRGRVVEGRLHSQHRRGLGYTNTEIHR